MDSQKVRAPVKPTIISRVYEALRSNGRPDDSALIDELKVFLTDMRASLGQFMELNQKARHTMSLYVWKVQMRCPHHEWMFDNAEPECMSCYLCEITVRHAKVAELAKRVKQGGYYIFVRTGGRVTPPGTVRAAIKDQLKRPKPEEPHADQETLRSNSNGTGESQAASDIPTIHTGTTET